MSEQWVNGLGLSIAAVLRTSSQSIPTITVPANGVTTTDTLAITL